MAHPSHPLQGARFQIERIRGGQSEALYRVQIHQESARYESQVELKLESKQPEWGELERSPEDAPVAPEWLVRHANALLRQCLQQARTKGSWPRRIRRWRDAPTPSNDP